MRGIIVLVMVLVAAPTAAASHATRNGVLRLKWSRTSAILRAQLGSGVSRSSPQIVFVGLPRSSHDIAIYSIRVDGKGLRRIAAGWDPAVSPDRTTVAFTDGIGISVVRANGTAAHEIVGGLGDEDRDPAWSPDGRRLVFNRYGGSVAPREGLWTMNPDGSAKRYLAAAPQAAGPSWIDPRHMLITTQGGAGGGFAIIDSLDGHVEGSILALASGPPTFAKAALSPNGRVLAYNQCNGSGCSSPSVALITLDGRLIRRIAGASDPAWSPGGELLYSLRDQIMLAPTRGGTARAITPRSLDATQPAWLG